MEFEEFETRLHAAQSGSAELPEEFSPFDFWSASVGDIQRVEKELGVQLPDKYRQYMLNYGGGAFRHVDLVPVLSRDGEEGLLEVNEGARSSGFVAVSPVGTGDLWGFSVVGGVCSDQVDCWFHEDGRTEPAAGDFLELL